ncbi:MAG: terminase large subunit domain-containing protein, partial [Shinella sp.]
MLPRAQKVGRNDRRLGKALDRKIKKIAATAAAGFTMIDEKRGWQELREKADALEAGIDSRNVGLADGNCPSSPCRDLLSEGGEKGDVETAETPSTSIDGEGGRPCVAVDAGNQSAGGRPETAARVLPTRRAGLNRWKFQSRLAQMPPPGDWRVWLLMGGRGSGKTRAGAEWVHAMALAQPDIRIALVAETLGDGREVMIDGVSGICRIAGRVRPEFEASRRRLVWPNGSIGQIFSSEDPESLRGPQFHLAWCDEVGKWKHAQETWDMLQFGLRLGDDPRVLVTTTPRPVPLLRALSDDPRTQVRRISTQDNAKNLSPGFLTAMADRYGGTRLGRQELDGELIADREDALWN